MIGDDPASVERFGQEVAPAVRELVAAGRAEPGTRHKSAEPDAADANRPVGKGATTSRHLRRFRKS